ncbi:hypothetical protein [Sphingobacterium thalpophilum]|uniref:tetratricopeptide repeat protein n=1 Tax=Sphingobacterium thalpophilum TaxID=259 RepID=UPI003C78E272
MKQMISHLSVILQGNVLTEADFQFPPTVLLAKYSFLPITCFFPNENIAIVEEWFETLPRGVIKELFTGVSEGLLASGNPVERFETIISSTGHVLAYSYLGLYYYKINAYQQAAEVYSRAIEKYQDEAHFYASRCLIYRLMGEEEGAFYDYQIAKRLDFNYHSVLEWQENQSDIAYLEADNLVIQELEPKQQQLSGDELNSLGLEYVHCYDYVKAIELYSMAIERNGGAGSNLFIFRGSLYLKLTCFELALRDFNQALILDAQQTAAYIFRAKVFESYRYTQKALADYAKAEELDAQSSIVFEERASLFERLGSLHEALSDFDRLVELNPTDFYVYSLRADLKEKLADMQGALLDYSRAIELNPYYSDLYAYRAAIKEKLGDSEGAKQDLEKFEELEDE